MIGIALVAVLLGSTSVGEREIAEVLASSLSTPRLALTPDAAAGLTGRAFLTVAGPRGALQVEPWLFVARLPWLFRAQGWESRLLHNGCASWAEARESIIATGKNRRPAVWVWSGEGADQVWGWGNREPPSSEGCFIAVVGDEAVEPQPAAATVAMGILEALSWAHAATSSGLSGLEPSDDPYTGQGFGAYKRLYADISASGERAAELADMVARWAERRRQAGRYLRWAATYLPEHAHALAQAAGCFEQEAIQCLDSLAVLLAGEGAGAGHAPELLWRGLSWYIKGMQSLEPVAFSSAALDSSTWGLLHAPDEEPVSPSDVVGPLLQLSRHPLPAVRRIALRKLGGVPLEQLDIPVLVAALRDGDAMVQQAALAALEAARPPDLRTILWEAYETASPMVLHGNGPVHRALVLALTRVREAEVPGLLATAGSRCLLGDCRPRSLPTWCAEGIVGLFGEASWPYLEIMLHSPCPASREAAAVALGRLGLVETQSELHAIAFRDSSAVVRSAALGALGRMGSEEAIDRLIELAGSPDPETKVAAAAGLLDAGQVAVPLITERMGSAGPELVRVLEAVLAALRPGEARNLLKY